MSSLRFICMLLICTTAVSAKAVSGNTVKKFNRLLNENKMFELKSEVESASDDLKPWYKLYFKAHIDNAFGKPAQSNEAIELILTKYSENFNKKQLMGLLSCYVDNHSKLYDYQIATDVAKSIVDKYAKTFGQNEIANCENLVKLWGSISNVPPQRVHHATTTEVPITLNQFNHWIIPVKTPGQTEETQFVFDTGANISTLNRTTAEEMGVVFTGKQIEVANVIGGSVNVETGYIPELFIGDLRVENMVVLIMPDEMLTFEIVNYKINGIIGFPVIRAFGEFGISNKGVLKIYPKNSYTGSQNIFTNGLTPFIMAEVANERLTLVCDTGAASSNFSKRYYKSNRSSVNASATKTELHVGGAGGVKKMTSRVLNNFRISVASKDFILDSVNVLKDSKLKNKSCDGYLGQDVLMQSGEIVMNFRDMYLFFRD